MEWQELEKIRNSERWFEIEDLNNEIWKFVPGWEQKYQISNY